MRARIRSGGWSVPFRERALAALDEEAGKQLMSIAIMIGELSAKHRMMAPLLSAFLGTCHNTLAELHAAIDRGEITTLAGFDSEAQRQLASLAQMVERLGSGHPAAGEALKTLLDMPRGMIAEIRAAIERSLAS